MGVLGGGQFHSLDAPVHGLCPPAILHGNVSPEALILRRAWHCFFFFLACEHLLGDQIEHPRGDGAPCRVTPSEQLHLGGGGAIEEGLDGLPQRNAQQGYGEHRQLRQSPGEVPVQHRGHFGEVGDDFGRRLAGHARVGANVDEHGEQVLRVRGQRPLEHLNCVFGESPRVRGPRVVHRALHPENGGVVARKPRFELPHPLGHVLDPVDLTFSSLLPPLQSLPINGCSLLHVPALLREESTQLRIGRVAKPLL
mmetsp:Transcript_3796/g.8338  ORF Transcript_3796/g.8338 Transcript_3796/m.8338 type:complete len:253 (-) Transcript_3796:239-997(-)